LISFRVRALHAPEVRELNRSYQNSPVKGKKPPFHLRNKKKSIRPLQNEAEGVWLPRCCEKELGNNLGKPRPGPIKKRNGGRGNTIEWSGWEGSSLLPQVWARTPELAHREGKNGQRLKVLFTGGKKREEHTTLKKNTHLKAKGNSAGHRVLPAQRGGAAKTQEKRRPADSSK